MTRVCTSPWYDVRGCTTSAWPVGVSGWRKRRPGGEQNRRLVGLLGFWTKAEAAVKHSATSQASIKKLGKPHFLLPGVFPKSQQAAESGRGVAPRRDVALQLPATPAAGGGARRRTNGSTPHIFMRRGSNNTLSGQRLMKIRYE